MSEKKPGWYRDGQGGWSKADPNLDDDDVMMYACSCTCMSKKSPMRKTLINFASSVLFDHIILLMIVLNSLTLAMIDYSPKYCNSLGEPTARIPKGDESWRNQVVEFFEPIFMVVFTLECVIKIYSYGFAYGHHRAYLQDNWNCLDFLVVASGLILVLLEDLFKVRGLPNMSWLRTFRILRPLKSLSKLRGLKILITALLSALPSLSAVVFLLTFALTVFSIVGMQFFKGATQTRCRITPYPVVTPDRISERMPGYTYFDNLKTRWEYQREYGWEENPMWAEYINFVRNDTLKYFDIDGLNYERNGESVLRCLRNVPNDDEKWELRDQSAWAASKKGPQKCLWPLDDEDSRVCSLGGGAGFHHCSPTGDYDRRWCGSAFDKLGNARFQEDTDSGFIDTVFGGAAYGGANFTCPYPDSSTERKCGTAKILGAPSLLRSAEMNGDLNFGYTTFNNLAAAWLTVFQSVTMEGWTPIMYMLADGAHPFISILLFIFLVLFGSFLVLNLVLAVITKQIEEMDEAEEKAEEDAAAAALAAGDKPEPPEDPSGYWLWPGAQIVRNLVEHLAFVTAINVAILVNTLLLALDRFPMDMTEGGDMEQLELGNLYLSYLFILEMFLKLAGIGPKEYAADSFNLFDAVIVLTSIIEMMIGSGSGISALRSFRIMRIFKLAKSWQSMQKLLGLIVKTMYDVAYVGLLLALFIFIYALAGMQFFANKLVFHPKTDMPMPYVPFRFQGGGHPYYQQLDREGADGSYTPRHNFDTFLLSVTTVFQILTGEDWNACMYDGWRGTSWLATIYYLTLVIIGGFIVMNLFLAVLLSNFEGNEDLVGSIPEGATIPGVESGHGGKVMPEGVDPAPRADRACGVFTPANPVRKFCTRLVNHPLFDRSIIIIILLSSLALACDNPLEDRRGKWVKFLNHADIFFTLVFTVEMVVKMIAMGVMFNGPESYFLNSWNVLDFIIVVISLANVGNLLKWGWMRSLRTVRVLRPLRMISRFPQLKLVVDALLISIPSIINVAVVCFIFFLIFAIIAVNNLKGGLMACMGDDYDGLGTTRRSLVEHPKQWNHLPDMKIWDPAVGALRPAVDVIKEEFPVCYAKYDNTIRYHDEGCGGKNAKDPACITLVENACVGEGSNQKCGKPRGFWRPMIGRARPIDDERAAKWGGSREPPRWPTSKDVCKCMAKSGMDIAWDEVTSQNFNNVFAAMATLYEISTTENWAVVMYAAWDMTGVHMQPLRENNDIWVLFFILFMMIGSFFVMNLFVGVVIEKFNQIREEKISKSGQHKVFMTKEQEQWVRLQAFISMKVRPRMPPKIWVRSFYDLATKPWFDPFIMGCIILNTCTLAIESYGQADWLTVSLGGINYLFAFIFTVECIVKLLGYGRYYFADPWNQFDFVIVMATAIGLVLKWMGTVAIGSVPSVLRICRIGRVLRLINSAKSLKQLFNTMISGLPSLFNVGMLMLIIFFIFAVMGNQMFAAIDRRNGEMVDMAHFSSFGTALLTLLRFSTGENWNGYMHGMTFTGDGCQGDGAGNPPKNPRHNGKHEGWCETQNGVGGETESFVKRRNGEYKLCKLDDNYCKEYHVRGGLCNSTNEVLCEVGAPRPCVNMNGCGSPVFGVFYFYLFTLVVTFVMLNLFIGIILDAFSDEKEEDDLGLSEENMDKFVQAWAEPDPNGTGTINMSALAPFVKSLDPPMGFGGQASQKEVDEEVQLLINDGHLEIEEPEGGEEPRIRIDAVCIALSRRLMELHLTRERDEDGTKGPGAPSAAGDGRKAKPDDSTTSATGARGAVIPIEQSAPGADV